MYVNIMAMLKVFYSAIFKRVLLVGNSLNKYCMQISKTFTSF